MVAMAVRENRRKTMDPLEEQAWSAEAEEKGGQGGGLDEHVQKMNFSIGVKMYTLKVTSTWYIFN